MIRAGSKTFAAAALLLPGNVREASYAIYAFCRLSDDAVDIGGGSAEAVARLRQRLDRAYAGNPADSPVDRAFADVVRRHAIPAALPEALLDGLEWDVAGVTCETEADVYAYAARVAGSVGAMMTALMGVRDPASIARACDLGVAMQLTNIARDVGEDALAGRLYLPRAWLREAGVDPDAWLARPVFTQAIGTVIARLLALADTLYARAGSGIRFLPPRCRPAIFAASHLYREIGAEVARAGFDSVSARARVPAGRKLRLGAKALADAASRGTPSLLPPLAETEYLVDATARVAPRLIAGELGRTAERLLWVAELFASLDSRARFPREGA
jgi:phytoene synthase